MLVDDRGPFTAAPLFGSTSGDRPTRVGPAPNPLTELIVGLGSSDGQRPFLHHARSARRVTFDALLDSATRWTGLLDDAGIEQHAVVSILVEDPLDFAGAYLGTIAGGRWAAPLDPALPSAALGRSLDRLGATAVVAGARQRVVGDVTWTGSLWPGGRSRPADQPEPVDLILRPAPPTLLAPAPGGTDSTGGHGGALLSSSGTSGRAKIVPLPVRHLLHAARSVVEHHRLGPGDRGFNPLPLFHVNAEVVGLLAQLVAGSCLVLDDRFHRTGFWDVMDRCSVSWINAVPAIVARLGTLGPGERVPAGIRFIRSASAPLPPAALRRFEKATGIAVVETYGMTEAASQITANPIDGPRKPGTVGVPVGVELRIVGGDGHNGTSGAGGAPVVGRVEIRGPSVVTSYLGGEHCERFDADGWLDTGDVGWLDPDGYLTLAGRGDDVINRGGEKVFPREIEEAILGDPGVEAVAVVPRSDDVLGEVPVAYLVLTGSDTTGHAAEAVLQRVRAHLVTELVRSKRPRHLYAVARLPTGPTGKVQRRLVREDPPGHYAEVDDRTIVGRAPSEDLAPSGVGPPATGSR